MRLSTFLAALALLGFSMTPRAAQADPNPFETTSSGSSGSTYTPPSTPNNNPFANQGGTNPFATGADNTADWFQRYVDSDYDYCDAKVLAGYWSADTYETKTSIGYKLANGYQSMLDSSLNDARMAAANNINNRDLHCDYSMIGYSYADAEALAGYWGVDTWDAKLRIEEKYLRDGHQRTHIDAALQAARNTTNNNPFDQKNSGGSNPFAQ